MRTSTFGCGTMPCISVLVAAAAFASLAAPAVAQDSEYGTQPFYAEETGVCYGEESQQDGILSVNSAYWDDVYVPCFSFPDACKERRVLNVGDVRVGRIGGSYYSTPDAYFEGGECGWATTIGQSSGELYVYVGNVLAVNFSCSVGLRVGVELVIEEHATADCSGYAVQTWDDNQWCDVICLDGTGYAHMDAHGIGACEDYYQEEEEEEDDEPFALSCRMPDRVITVRSGYTYLTRVQSAIYVGGSWQYWTEQTGCFKAS